MGKIEYRRFSFKNDTEENRDRLEKLINDKNLSRDDLIFILEEVTLSTDSLKNLKWV